MRLAMVATLVLGVLAGGCGGENRFRVAVGARKEVGGPIVRDVGFEGNGGLLSGQSDFELQRAMEQEESSPGILTPVLNAFVTPVPLDREALLRDAYRLEVFYAHRGWFDARVVGWELRYLRRYKERGKRTDKAAVVDLVGHVEPGLPSYFREFTITGSRAAVKGPVDAARKGSGIVEGDQFSLDLVIGARDRLEGLLRDSSFAYATVEQRMDAWPEEQAVDVRLDIALGPSAYYESVTVEGNDKVRTEYILQEIGFADGDRYEISQLSRARRRLFALGTFNLVSVQPDLSDPTDPSVPVTVRVSEAPFHTVEGGGGVEYDGITLTPRATALFSRVNAFRRLIRFETEGNAGYALPLTGGNVLRQGLPIYSLRASAQHPRVLGGPNFTLSGEVSLEQDLQGGHFPYRRPEIDLGLSWRVDDDMVLSAGPHFEAYRLLESGGTGSLVAEALFGEEFTNPYQLATVDATFTVDWRRGDPVQPNRGSFWQAGGRQALGGLLGDYLYTELNAETRGWIPLGRRLVLSGRLKGRALQSWGESALPYPERVFLGGASDIRGFRTNHLGAYDCLCIYTPARTGDAFTGEPGAGLEVDRRYLPAGGAFGVWSTGELRLDDLFGDGIAGAVYLDLGYLGDRLTDFDLANLGFGGGLGIRYASPIGPLRVDLAARPVYAFDRSPRRYVNCLVEDQLPRSFDLFSDVARGVGGRDSWDPASRSIPVALNFYIAIGNPF